MRPQGLIPGVQDHGAPDLPAEVAVPKLHERLTRRVEQQGQQRSLVGEDEGIEGVGHGKHQVEIGHRQQLGFAVLDPLDLGKRLTLGAVTIATGIIRVPFEPTAGTVFGVPAELRRPAGLEVAHHLLMRGRHGMGTAVCLPVEAEDIGDFPRWGAGLAPSGSPGQSVACGRMGLLRRGQGWVPAGQEVEWAADRRQMLPGDPEVPRGGIERPMAQQHLDRPDIDPRFEQVGRKTMAQRMDAVAVRDPRSPLRMIVDLLGRADGHRRMGIEARKQPRAGR